MIKEELMRVREEEKEVNIDGVNRKRRGKDRKLESKTSQLKDSQSKSITEQVRFI